MKTKADPQDPPSDPPGAPPDPPAPLEPPAPPKAAQTVLEGTKTERELSLERDLKARETRVSELEDENRQLKSVGKPPKADEKSSWLDHSTFFDEE